MNGISLGFTALWQGFRLFYTRPPWWKYALLPLLILGIVYSGLFWFTGGTLLPWLLGFLPVPDGHGFLVGWMIRVLLFTVSFSGWVLLILIVLLSFSSLYEMVSAFFFDALVEKCRMEQWGLAPRKAKLKYVLKFCGQTTLFGINSGLLALCLLPVTLIPVLGPVCFGLVMGRRYGLSGMFAAAFAEGLYIRDVKRLAGSDRASIYAFGVPASLLLTIPVLSVFFLPAVTVGGTLLYQQLKRKAPLPDLSRLPGNRD